VSRQPRRRSAEASRTTAAAAAQPAAPVSIDIDSAVTAGYILGRYDLVVRGRALSSTPVEEIAVTLGDVVVGRVQFGRSYHASLAGESGRVPYVFHVNLPLRPEQATQTCHCTIVARLRDNGSHEQNFSLAIDTAKTPPVSVASGPISPAAAYSTVPPPIVLYVERAALDDAGRLLLHGWAVSLTPMVTVQVFADDELLDSARHGDQRIDVGQAFPQYPNAAASGFRLSRLTHLAPAAISTLRIQAICQNGFMHEAIIPVERPHALVPEHPVAARPQRTGATLAIASLQEPVFSLAANFQLGPDLTSLLSSPSQPLAEPAYVRDPRREIRYFCDEMTLTPNNGLAVVGWAVCAVGIASITVYLDGEPAGEAELGLLREDVGEEYRQIPMARYSGFRFHKPIDSLASGEHWIRVVLRNGLDDEKEEVRSVLIERAAAPPPPPLAPPAEPTQFRLEIDAPTVLSGAAVDPVTERLTIEGWALARSGVASIEVMLDDQRLGDAYYGLARQDVGTAFPDWPNSLRSGYAFHCPPRSLRNGDHVVRLNVRARSGEVLEHSFRIQVRRPEDFEQSMTIRRRMTLVEQETAEAVLDGLGHRPGFRLILRPGATVDGERLAATVASVRSQAYRDWRLQILADGNDDAEAVRAVLAEQGVEPDEPIEVIDSSQATSPGAAGLLIGFLTAGDQLGCDALLRIALAGGLHRDADMLYADELRVSPVSHEREVFSKPDFSPDLLLSTNYIGRPWFATSALLAKTGLTLRDVATGGEYDAVLRCAEQATFVHHVPSLLCLRGATAIDDPETEVAALTRAAARRGMAAEVLAGAVPGTWRVRRTHTIAGRVSIIIPTCAARGFIETCIKSLRERTAYRNFEIICIDDIPNEQVAWKVWLQENADRIVQAPDEFNWSRFNNRGVEAASGEFLLFLNDDVEVIQPEWLDAMLEHVLRPEVAVVGAQLLYPDHKVQHAGMFLATRDTARHAFRFASASDPGYFGLALTQRNVIAVTGACMLMRRSVYDALGGFEEAHEIINNDLDFCLRAHRAGKLVVFTPYASLIHHEAASRDRLRDVFDLGHFEARWSTLFAAGDPYFSPHLSRQSDDYRPDDEPAETIFAGHPLFRHADIKRILAVKVDHIGDFVTALPAIRRLKARFPAASIHVLASRAARAIAATEDCIDAFIEFEFFHTVSGLGPRDIGEAEYQALRDRLAPYRFDIAVDLRKHLDTRDVLRYTPARFLAGYDYLGQYPFLDIALEWEGDRYLERKRSHISDDLLNLVEAIGTAGATDRTNLARQPSDWELPDFLPAEARALFAKPVVAVHPGVGNAMRQWPPEHFASLIDLLAELNGVNAVLIGGAEEADLAEQVLSELANREAVVSLVGKTSLRQLPELLQACALYIGNNSGPKHIAAALGVPTIGIHSGVVDATEWGPSGQRAVAIRRNMTCSPCYLARLEDCPRSFVCMHGLAPASVQSVAEVFLARPVERRATAPLVERQPDIVEPPAEEEAPKPRRTRRRTPAARRVAS
jgi:ADP-heptose:LPS heptosyltransferase/GT2 family glycosyltransferase